MSSDSQQHRRQQAGATNFAMDVYWVEQTVADVPPDDEWLSASEALHLGGLRFPKRRADWRLGRWTAKCAIAAYLDTDRPALRHIEIRAADSGSPEAFLGAEPAPVAISISHCHGVAACAVALAETIIGCDLEGIEPRSRAFVADYFTAEEQMFIARAPADDRDAMVTLLWSAKESALKGLQEGLRLDTRSCVVTLVDAPGPTCYRERARAVGAHCVSAAQPWHPLRVRHADVTFEGWYRGTGELVRTLIAAPPSGPPIQLAVPQPAVIRRYA